MTRQYLLRVSEKQTRVLKDALDLYARIGMAQLTVVGEKIREWCPVGVDVTDPPLIALKRAVYTDLQGDYYSIRSPAVPADAKTAWDLQQVIRRPVALDRQEADRAAGKAVHSGVDTHSFMATNPDVPPAVCVNLDVLLGEARKVLTAREWARGHGGYQFQVATEEAADVLGEIVAALDEGFPGRAASRIDIVPPVDAKTMTILTEGLGKGSIRLNVYREGTLVYSETCSSPRSAPVIIGSGLTYTLCLPDGWVNHKIIFSPPANGAP